MHKSIVAYDIVQYNYSIGHKFKSPQMPPKPKWVIIGLRVINDPNLK